MRNAAWLVSCSLFVACEATAIELPLAPESTDDALDQEVYVVAAPAPPPESRPYPCPTQYCTCRASDAQGDLLCKTKPTSNAIGACATKDLEGHIGQPGGACSGFGPRQVGNDTKWMPAVGTIESCYPQIDPTDPSCKLMHDYKCAIRKCDEAPLTTRQLNRIAKKETVLLRCSALGTIKHACVEKQMSADPNGRVERSFDTSASPPRVVKNSRGKETVGFWQASRAAKLQGLAGPIVRPDMITNGPAPYDVLDAKFPCPDAVKNNQMGRNAVQKAPPQSGQSMMTSDQRATYQSITQGGSVTPISPEDSRGEVCP